MAPQRSPASDGGTGTERQLWPSCYEKSPETHTQECWNLWLRLGPCCQTWGWGQAQEEGILYRVLLTSYSNPGSSVQVSD